MTTTDEQELLRLTGLLESLHERIDDDPNGKEALRKAAVAVSVAFIHGLRPEIERLYSTLGKPLPAAERADLLRLGIDPDVDPDS